MDYQVLGTKYDHQVKYDLRVQSDHRQWATWVQTATGPQDTPRNGEGGGPKAGQDHTSVTRAKVYHKTEAGQTGPLDERPETDGAKGRNRPRFPRPAAAGIRGNQMVGFSLLNSEFRRIGSSDLSRFSRRAGHPDGPGPPGAAGGLPPSLQALEEEKEGGEEGGGFA